MWNPGMTGHGRALVPRITLRSIDPRIPLRSILATMWALRSEVGVNGALPP
jgi:hypothetical protein